ncbi:MAG: YceI family protein [Acidimicrobiia bacterium]|jgi:polyisoprenoid-binding protein YceI
MTTDIVTRPEIEPGLWTIDPAHTRVGFQAKHLMVTKVRGTFESYEAKIEVAEDLTESKIEVAFDAASISTGAGDRDDHLRSGDFLDVDNHPTVTFVSTNIEREGDGWKITGDLTIRDVTHPVTFEAVYEGSVVDPWGNDHVAFSASGRLNREDWGLTWNAALEGGGWLVSREIGLEFEGQLVRP